MDERPPPQDAEEVDESDPLHALFSGKRAWPRLTRRLPVEARGTRTTYRGGTVDLSRRGVLFAVEDRDFYDVPGDGVARIEEAFPDGLEIRFPGALVAVPAVVVRVTPIEGGRLAIGCRFLRDLDVYEAVMLGVRAAEAELTEALASELPLRELAAGPLSLALVAPRPAASPAAAFSGRVIGVGERTVDATAVTLATPAEVAKVLAEGPLKVVFRMGRRRVAEVSGLLATCGFEPDGERTRVRVVLDAPVPRDVLSCFEASARDEAS